jgi:mono/diheme cytochrome c family protein
VNVIQRRAWPGVLLVAPLVLVGAESLSPTPSRAQDGEPDPARQSARLFAKTCASCHVYPDASYATDRAWLGQVLETA